MSTETSLEIVRVRADEAKRALAEFSAAADERLAYLYRRYAELRAEHWPGDILPDAIIAIGQMNDKTLAHYKRENAHKMPNEIEFNRNFVALNWDNRQLVDSTLLHEMIHLWQHAVLDEQHTSQQAAHGRSFRKEAKRVGVEGKGRLMACPYPVKMPAHYARPSRRTQAEAGEGGDGDKGKGRRPAPADLVQRLREYAEATLPSHQADQLEKHFAAIEQALQETEG